MLKMNKKGASLGFDQIKNKKVASSVFWEIENKQKKTACLICFSKKWPEKHLFIFFSLSFHSMTSAPGSALGVGLEVKI